MRRNQGDHAVATEAKPVHPVGQPISASTNAGFSVRGVSQVSSPASGVTRTWRPSKPFTGVFANVLAPSLWSRAVGVIHSAPAWVRSAVRRLPALGLHPSAAIGVGQRRSISVRLPPLERIPEQARGVGQLVSLADGEDEETFAPMGRTDFRRREEACRKPVAQTDQSCGDFGETEAEMMGDIFEEDEGRLNLADDAGDMRPEVAGVVRTPAFTRHAERLARIARSDDVHRAEPWAAVEAGNVVPERRVIQGRVFHPRHDNGRGEGVPLDVTHSSISGAGNGKPDIEATGTSTEGQAEEAGAIGSGRQAGGRYNQVMHGLTRRSCACARVLAGGRGRWPARRGCRDWRLTAPRQSR